MRKTIVSILACVVTVLLLGISLSAQIFDSSPESAWARQQRLKKFLTELAQFRDFHSLEETCEFAEKEGPRVPVRFLHPDSPEGKALIEKGEKKLGQLRERLRKVAYAPAQDLGNCAPTCSEVTVGACVYACVQFWCPAPGGFLTSISITAVFCGDSSIEFPPETGVICCIQ